MLFAERKLPWGDGTATFTDAAPSLVVSKETGSVEMLADGLIAKLTEQHRHITFIDSTGHILRYFTREGVTPVFGLGFVPASREAKVRLGVPGELVELEGEHSLAVTHALVHSVQPKMKNDTVVTVNGKYLVWSDPEQQNRHHEIELTFDPELSAWEKRQAMAHQTFATILSYVRGEKVDTPFITLPESVISQENQTMMREIVDAVKTRNWKVAFAASCTGGAEADIFLSIPGASDVFYGGYIPYSEVQKQELLRVSGLLLTDGGVYSNEVTTYMCVGAHELSGADIVISWSGLMNTDDMRLREKDNTHDDIQPGRVFSTIIVNGYRLVQKKWQLDVTDRDSMKVEAAMQAFRALHGFLKEKGLLEIIPPEISVGG